MRLNYLGLLVYSEGKIEDAKKILGWALYATAQSTGEQSVLTGACLNDYAKVLKSMGYTSEADEYERTAYDILSNRLMRQAKNIAP
jgi:hypothetical protein